MTHLGFQVTQTDHKRRLDEFLFRQFPQHSRLYLRELVRDEKCEVNGRWENRGYILRTNDYVEIEIDELRHTTLEAEDIQLEIVLEEPDFLIVNKPPGMLIHPTVGVRRGTLLNGLAHYLNLNLADASEFVRAGLVHRLDKDTSGLVLIAKTARAHRILCHHFQRKLVSKRYVAVVRSPFEEDAGEISAPIGRFAEARIWDVKADGKPSLTRFAVQRRTPELTFLELEPVTGRTNQLRIHLASRGYPILGDTKYGGGVFPRLCLHACRLEFWHPDGGRRVLAELSVPSDFPEI